jgi:SAM-dependent methyltransferase
MVEERHSAETQSPWWGEHIFRYQWADQYVRAPMKILDLACGTGFGSARLSRAEGVTVIGGDLDPPSLAAAAAEFGAESGPHFAAMDGTRLPLPDRSLDLVVSYETLEHIEQYRDFVGELARIIKKTGTLLVSTPNRPVTSPDGVIRNPFHTQEFDVSELRAVLSDHFSEVAVMGQHYARFDRLHGLRGRIGKAAESIFYLRGVRKLPMRLQNGVMRSLIGHPQYPSASDYQVVSDPARAARCQTLMAVASGPMGDRGI